MTEEAFSNNVGFWTIAATSGQFSNNFFKAVANDNPGNLITSPFSAQMVLAMAAYGAGGTTATQMRSVLLIPNNNKLGQSGYQSLIESFNSAKGVEIRLANKIYTASQIPLKSTFKELTAGKFLSANQELDFNKPTAAATTINNWCEEQTKKRIKDVITPDDISSDIKMVLVSAVHFKGQWQHKFFRPATQDRPFHVDEKTVKSVPTMFVRNTFRFGDLPQLKARFIEMPYQGNRISMIIILPNEVNGLKTVQDKLQKLNLSENLQQASPKEIELFLPKFKIESTLNLKKTLEKLGMTDIFEDEADFSGIADTPLKVSKVLQKAYIDVNEEGSEAAAVIAGVDAEFDGISSELQPTFQVDRPYHYAIYHLTTGISIFTGIVKEPKLT